MLKIMDVTDLRRLDDLGGILYSTDGVRLLTHSEHRDFQACPSGAAYIPGEVRSLETHMGSRCPARDIPIVKG